MKTKEIIKRAREFAKPFRITKEEIPSERRRSKRHARIHQGGRQTESKGSAGHRRHSVGRIARQTIRAGQVGGAPDLSIRNRFSAA